MARTNLAARIVAIYGSFVKFPKMATHKLPKMAKFGFTNFCQVWSPNIPLISHPPIFIILMWMGGFFLKLCF